MSENFSIIAFIVFELFSKNRLRGVFTKKFSIENNIVNWVMYTTSERTSEDGCFRIGCDDNRNDNRVSVISFEVEKLIKRSKKNIYNVINTQPAEKAMWRSVFLTIWHRILNSDSTKTPSSSVTF